MSGRFRLLLLCLLTIAQRVSSTGVNQGHTTSESGSSLFFYQDQIYPKDCSEVQDQCSPRNTTGAHLIRPDGYHEPFWVFCSGEWTVLQRRTIGLLDFNRNWDEYQDGFGYLNVDHWLGNEKIAQLTNQRTYELRIELETESGQRVHITYDRFRITDKFSDYKLVSLGRHGGTAESAFTVYPSNLPRRDCYGILRSGDTASGDYTIKPSGWTGAPFTVNCNMTIDGGGWTVIQRRIQSTSRLDFNRNWEPYQTGFGDPSGEFWIGNEKLFFLTNQKEYELRIDMVAYDGTHQKYFAKYNFFRINGVSDKYRMIGLGNHTGTAFDGLRSYHHMQFSTPDQDNDLHPGSHCADNNDDGWWHYYCYYYGVLNYYSSSSYFGYWYYVGGSYVLLYSEMKIRPKHIQTDERMDD